MPWVRGLGISSASAWAGCAGSDVMGVDGCHGEAGARARAEYVGRVLSCVDVSYNEDLAIAGCLLFEHWSAERASERGASRFDAPHRTLGAGGVDSLVGLAENRRAHRG